MNYYINQNGSLTEAGTDLYDHIESLLRSVVAENSIDAVTMAYIAHQAVESVNIGMVLDVDREPKKIKLWGEVA